MASRQDYYWLRLLGTAASFALFGLIGILLGVVALPLSRLVPLSPQRRTRFGRGLVTRCFRLFIGFCSSTRTLSYEFRGHERLGRPGQLIIANHPSLIDVVFLIGFAPAPGCVVKAALWRNPFTAGVAASAGYVPNMPTDTMIELASAALQEGQTLIMFPEGTRTRPGAPLEFHRGAASVAVRAARFVTPVYITVTPTTLTKGEPWYRIPVRRPHFALTVGEDIALEEFRARKSLPLAGRALNAFLLDHYSARLSAAAGSGVATA